MNNKISYFLIVVLAIICLALLHKNSSNTVATTETFTPHSGAPYAVPSVEVNVTESQKFEANEFKVRVSIEMRNRDKEALFKQIDERRKKFFAIAKEHEISESDIQQNSVDLRKEWTYKDGIREFAQYEASQSFVVTIEKKQDAADFIQALSLEPELDLGRTVATLKDSKVEQEKIIRKAGEKAMAKAEIYAKSVGAKLGKVLYIGSGYNNDGVVFADNMNGVAMLGSARAKGMPGDMNAIADSVQISAEIHLIVEIK